MTDSVERGRGAENAAESATEQRTFDKLFVCYVVAWILEGVLRKWLLPSLATPLVLFRLPIAIALLYVAFRTPRAKAQGALALFVAVCGLLALASIFHVLRGQPIVGAVNGLRLYVEPLIVVLAAARAASRDLLQRVAKLIVVSAPLTAALALLQVLSPRTAWVNRLLDASGEGVFVSSGDFVRATGWFTSPAGHAAYLSLALMSYIVVSSSGRGALPRGTLGLAACSVGLMIVSSGSRGTVFLGLGTVVLWLFFSVRRGPAYALSLSIKVVGLSSVLYLLSITVLREVTAAFQERFESAARSEDTGGRIAETGLGFLDWWSTASAFGTGVGSRTANSAAGIEDELARWVVEQGYVLFMIAMTARLAVVAWLAFVAGRSLARNELGRATFAAVLVPTIGIGQFTGQTSVGGFAAIALACLIAGAHSERSQPYDGSSSRSAPSGGGGDVSNPGSTTVPTLSDPHGRSAGARITSGRQR